MTGAGALPRSCAGCGDARVLKFVEERRDPVGGVTYRLYRCGACSLVFSDPRDPIGPEWYEKYAPLRAVEVRPPAVKDWRFTKFLDAGLPPGKVLDVGCGDGRFLTLAGERGWKGVGVDYETRIIALARAQGVDAYAQDYESFLKGRAAKEFDAVVLFDVLEHATEPRALLALVKPVLKRGGVLAVTFPNDSRPLPFGREEFDYPPHHFTRWNPEALGNFLRAQGFSIVALEAVGPTVKWFSETLYFSLIAPAAISVARRLLFGARSQGTLSGLYESGGTAAPSGGAKGFLSDRARRQALTNAFKYACRVATYPAGIAMALLYRLSRRDCGEYLFALARYEG